MALNQLVDSRDQRFVLFELLELEKESKKYPAYADMDKETFEEVLNLAERIAVDKFYPANAEGDKKGCTFNTQTKEVKIPDVYKPALDAFYEAGFIGIVDNQEIGGMGMPHALGMAANESLSAACMPAMMYPGLSHGCMLLVDAFGTQEQKDLYEECRAMMYSSVDAVKAGNTTWDLVKKWPDSPKYWGYEEWGEVFGYAVGHGLGISLHEFPMISYPNAKANPEKLEEGMVIALETWYGIKGHKDGVRLEDMVAVTKNGYDLLTEWPVDKLTECWV